MISITAEVDGQVFTVDLGRVSGWDALSYRHVVGTELDALVLRWCQLGKVPAFAADLAVAYWLWQRQEIDPMVPLADVAAQVPLLPSEPPAGEPVEDAPPADPEPPAGVPAPAPAPVPAAPMAGVAV